MTDTLNKTTGLALETFPSQTGTLKPLSKLVEDAGYLSTKAQVVSSEADQAHEDSQIKYWRVTTNEMRKRPALELLETLADEGFSWRHIAQMIGVSVPAVRKWRNGSKVSPDSHLELAATTALTHIISTQYIVPDVASWFEIPIIKGIPITPIDLYSSNRPDLVFRLATQHSDPEEIMTRFNPQWREEYKSDFKAVIANDGSYSIVPVYSPEKY